MYNVQDLVGESSRGPQDADVLGAVNAIVPHASPQQQVALARLMSRGAIRQSSQLGFVAVQAGITTIPTTGYAVSAVTRVQRKFKPMKFFVQEFISATDSSSVPNTAAGSSATAIDVFLTGAFMGGDNTFPNAPTTSIQNGSTAVNCSIFNSNNLGSGISWAEVPGGIDMTLNFVVAPSIIGLLGTWRAVGTASYTITISAQVMGPMVL